MLKKFVLLTLFILGSAIPALSADTVKMDCNAIYGASNFHSQGAVLFADTVNKYTDGSVTIAVHPGGSLGFKGPELLKAVKDGVLPMSDILMGVVAGSEQIFGLSSMPLVVDSYDEARKFYDAAKPYYEKACAKWNQKLLYAAPWPPSGLITKQPVNTIDDLKGLKIRTYDKNGATFLSMAGASPMSLPWGELYSALQTGLADSVLTSAVSGKDGKMWEVLGSFTKIYYAHPLNMLVVNLDYWKALSKDQQAAMLKAAAEVEQHQWQASMDSNNESLKALKDNGMAIADGSPELMKALKANAGKMLDEFKAGAKKNTKAALDAYLGK
ncbi:TRAP transporter substrate-binding protein [Desulfocurvus sp. DL9XJH121]